MDEYYDIDILSEDFLEHVGKGHLDGGHSGRYEWGSGEDPYQHDPFYENVKSLRAKGIAEKDIPAALGMSSTEYRNRITISKAKQLRNDQIRVRSMIEKRMSNVAIAEELGLSEGTVRNYRKNLENEKTAKYENVANTLISELNERGVYLDVGEGAQYEMGTSKGTLETALLYLKDQGYSIEDIKVPQATNPGQFTTVKVLAAPGTEKKDIYENLEKLEPVKSYFVDDGKSVRGLYPPESISSDRIKVIYAEEGGSDKDGVIELRPGVNDISLGNSKYAQVRIAVDGTHYLKGMAMYSDSIPEGYDLIFNTSKHEGTPILGSKDNTVLKNLKSDPANPFNSYIKANGQSHYIDPNGKYVKDGDIYILDLDHKMDGERYSLSAINKVNEEGDWLKWNKTIASQMLSKQPEPLVKKQLDISYAEKKSEFDQIMALNNPAIKQKFLLSFADDCDSSAVDLKAVGFPRQASRVILPVNDLKDNEIYAPDWNDGEKVALVRYPHAGRFEMPILVVNNQNPTAKKILGDARDAVGINSKVAEILSGADFDGDSVVVIPVNKNANILNKPPLKELEGFDHKDIYRGYEGMKVISPDAKQREMGKVTNLITDMTLKGAPTEQIAKAVKHSMVIIDSEKHRLDWQKSEKDNDISALKEEWQGGAKKGASTLISKASSEDRVNERKLASYVDPETGKKTWGINPNTGEKVYKETGRERILYQNINDAKTFVDPVSGKKMKVAGNEEYIKTITDPKGYLKDPATGKKIPKIDTKTGETKKEVVQIKTTKMAEAKDAKELSSGHPIDNLYADYANKLKALANQARKEYISTPNGKTNTSAKDLYSEEIKSLSSKLLIAEKNRPKERYAQIISTVEYRSRLKDNPYMDDDERNKVKQQTLASARVRVGAKKNPIDITSREWEAIQSGAISHTKQRQIFDNMDLDVLKKLATPRGDNAIPTTTINLARSLANNGYTRAEIADRIGYSSSTVDKILYGTNE